MTPACKFWKSLSVGWTCYTNEEQSLLLLKACWILQTLRLGSFMAAPPYLMTTVFPAKRWRYGRASERTDTLSKEENILPCTATLYSLHMSQEVPEAVACVTTEVS